MHHGRIFKSVEVVPRVSEACVPNITDLKFVDSSSFNTSMLKGVPFYLAMHSSPALACSTLFSLYELPLFCPWVVGVWNRCSTKGGGWLVSRNIPFSIVVLISTFSNMMVMFVFEVCG